MRSLFKVHGSFFIFCLLILSACVNPYHVNFNSTLSHLPASMGTRFVPSAGKPELRKVDNIQEENWGMYERGYIMVGYSKFDGTTVDDSSALSQAYSIGADIVLIEKIYSRTLTETVAVTQWADSQTTETQERTTVSGPRGDREITRTTEVTTLPEPVTSYVPQNVDFFQYSATYWRRVKSPIFGALVNSLTDEEKKALQTNRGLTIRAVMTQSPAYNADLLKGDIIVGVNGQPAPDPRKFYSDLASQAGKQMNLTIQRGDKKIEKGVSLNP